uniref:Dynein light chain n=1 Tax=Bos indicus x Bos taurus TaxID=30522 RepID=A0A4W2BT30_BOBOX
MSDRKAVIKNADMSEDMQQDAVDCATQAMEKYNIEKDIAAYIKKVLRLTCADTSVLEFLMICNCGMLDVIWFLLLLVSYSAIPGDAEVPLRTGKEEGSFHLHRPHCHGVYCLHSKHLPLCPALHLFLH